MPLLKSGEIVDDLWQRTEGETPLGSDGDVIIDWSRLKEDASLRGRNGRLGVQLANTVDVAELAPYLDRLALIVLEFPVVHRGRAFSQAAILRQQMGFAGELRAVGAPRADQAPTLPAAASIRSRFPASSRRGLAPRRRRGRPRLPGRLYQRRLRAAEAQRGGARMASRGFLPGAAAGCPPGSSPRPFRRP